MAEQLPALRQYLIDPAKKFIHLYSPKTLREKGWLWASGLLLLTCIVFLTILGLYWSREPEPFDIRENTRLQLGNTELEAVTGTHTTAALIQVIDTMLNKPGGFQSNDILPPTVFMDNIKNWEFGALVQSRDLARALRNDFGRSQSQSIENKSLAEAEPLLNFSDDSWAFPASEDQFRSARDHLHEYLLEMAHADNSHTQFYARADNLRDWLGVVEKRLGSLSQRLTASVGQARINTDLAGDPGAVQATAGNAENLIKTPWLEIDDVFYEARGSTWALIQFLKAIELDLQGVLKKKNALVSLEQIIRELEATQEPITSPMILNGRGMGLTANYSLVMASYISRANAAIIDLRELLSNG